MTGSAVPEAAAAANGVAAPPRPPPPPPPVLLQLTPRIGYDLRLHPPALDAAYWHERSAKLAQWDLQVTLFIVAMMVTMVFKFADEGLAWHLASFAPVWAMCLCWLAAMQHAAFYQAHRVAVVTAVRVLMGLTAVAATNGVAEQLHSSLMLPSPVGTVVFKLFVFCNALQLPIEAVRLQLPLRYQVPVTALKAACLMMGEFTPAFVAFTNTPRYAAALATSSAAWSALVASGSPVRVPPAARLAGRSHAAMEALAVLYASDVALVCYICYVTLWADIRRWLAAKAAAAGRASRDAPAGVVLVGGGAVSAEQLHDLCNSSAAAYLLGLRGWMGRVSQVLLHGCAANVLCLGALLFSQLLVRQVLPAVLSDTALDRYYPLFASQQEAA